MSALRGILAGGAALLALPALAAGPVPMELDIGGKVALGDLVRPDSPVDGAPLVLLVHGTLAHKDMEIMAALQTAFADRGVPSLAISLTLGLDRREGMYDCAVPHDHTMADAAMEISAWVAKAKAEGFADIAIMGHSRGGQQVAAYLSGAAYPAISHAILLAPAMSGDPEEGYEARAGKPLGPVLEAAGKAITAREPGTMIDTPLFLYCPDAKASARAIVSYYGPFAAVGTDTLLPELTLPVLVIGGTKDTVVPDVEARVSPIAEAMDNVSLEMVADADHLFLDFFAEDVADLVTAQLGAD